MAPIKNRVIYIIMQIADCLGVPKPTTEVIVIVNIAV